MTTTTTSTKATTPKFRGSFVRVFDAQETTTSKGEKKQQWSVEAIFDREADMSALKAAINEAIRKKWGDKKPANLQSPFRLGTPENFAQSYDQRPEIHNKIVMSFKSTTKPGVALYKRPVNGVKQKPELIDESKKGEIYSGAYYIATVSAFAWSYMGKNGVSFALNNLLKLHDGDALSPNVAADRDFEHIDGTEYGVDNSDEFADADASFEI